MNFIKTHTPNWLKKLILQVIVLPGLVLSPLFKSSRVLASLWYFLFSRQFDREHQAVLAGKVAYQKGLTKIGLSSVLLRRNIHRLEKGLIMKPRRDVFAENFIHETVNMYERAVKMERIDGDEKKWFTDVLIEYFTVVKSTNIIMKACNKFQACVDISWNKEKFIPYSFDALPKSDVSYEQLHELFIKRRSVRWYQEREVTMGLIEKAVNLATLAPSACNRQPYFFYVSGNKEKAVQIAMCAGGTTGWAENIPCIIAIVGDLSAYPSERDRHLIYIDGSLASMQLMLAFETLGLSTCSINWPDLEKAEKKIQKLLDLKNYQRPIMLLAVGYAECSGGIPYSQKKKPVTLLKTV